MNTFDRSLETPIGTPIGTPIATPIATPLATPLETPYDSLQAQHARFEQLEHEERERALKLVAIPALTGFLCLVLGFALGWSGGRADLLENTFVRDGVMVTHPAEPVVTETVPVVPGRVGPDRVGER